MSLANELRKIADGLDQKGARAARRLRIPLHQYNVFERLRELGEIKTIIDVGANRGEMVSVFARCFPRARIHAFEPLELCQPPLAQMKKELPQLTVHQVALGNHSGEMEMFQNDYAPSSGVLPMLDRHRELWPKTANEKLIKVPMVTLDSVAASEDFQYPAILKLDVQGFELHVLDGAENVLPHCSLVQLEVLFESLYEGQANFADLNSRLYAHGFHFIDFVEERRVAPSNRLIYADAAFMRFS
jgi:FkbM family methyltransferase